MKRILIVLIFFCTRLYSADSLVVESGNNQYGAKNEQLPNSLMARVFRAGSPASGESVWFNISSIPDGATGQNLNVASVVTPANGKAGVVFTFGDKSGAYQVSASVSGIDTVVFTQSAFPLKQTILRLQKEIEDFVNEGIKLIVAHESGISRTFMTISGQVIDFSAQPDATTKTAIMDIFKANQDEISERAMRIKDLIP